VNTVGRDDDLHRRAVELVRAAYHEADLMLGVDLAAVNRPRPRKLRYQSQDDLVREFVARAGAMLDFGVRLGLIEPDEDAEILRTLGTDDPRLDEWLKSEVEPEDSPG